MTRRVLLLLTITAAVCLIPWTAYLALNLPEQHHTDQWRLAWVGFDTALIGCFATAAWLDWRRRRLAIPMLGVTAALLCCDAWFDIMLESGSTARRSSVLMAALFEVPLAGFLVLRARILVAGVRGARQGRQEPQADVSRQVLNQISAVRAAYLTPADLERFTMEYDELLTRYRATSDQSAPESRTIALRLYAFPGNQPPTEHATPTQTDQRDP
jgi:hypothetical protein